MMRSLFWLGLALTHRQAICHHYLPSGRVTIEQTMPGERFDRWIVVHDNHPLVPGACVWFGTIMPPCTAPTFDQCVTR